MTNKFHASGFLALTRVDFGNDARRMQVLHRGEGCLIWAALGRVIEHARSKGLFEVLSLSYVPGQGCPEPFHLGLGFRHTGRKDDNEIILELDIA